MTGCMIGGGGDSFLPRKGCTLEQFECTVYNYSLHVYLRTVNRSRMFLFAVPIDFSFLSTHIISFFCSWTNPGFSLQFIFPKRITLSTLNSVKYCEENTEYSIFVSSESLSLTRGDNNYSALRRKNLNNGSNPP